MTTPNKQLVPKWVGSDSNIHYVSQVGYRNGNARWAVVLELPHQISTAKTADRKLSEFMDYLLDHYNKDYNDH